MTDTNSHEHLKDCLARHLIKMLRPIARREDRETKFRDLTKKYNQSLRDDLKERVRRLWNEGN